MSNQAREPSAKTKERYDLFVEYYLQSFNATKAAIAVGYSEKTARQQGHKLLTNAYIKQKITIEMGRLRDRMKDEGLRSFSMLLGIAIETEEKLQQHNVAEKAIEDLNSQIDAINLELMLLNNRRGDLQRSADAIDGRKANLRDHKRELLSRIEGLDAESLELEIEKRKLSNERSKHGMYYLPVKEWEKLQSLKKSIFQDILDRGGFKAVDKVEHSGGVGLGVKDKKELAKEFMLGLTGDE